MNKYDRGIIRIRLVAFSLLFLNTVFFLLTEGILYKYGKDVTSLNEKIERQAAIIQDREEQIEVLEIILEHQEEPVAKETFAGEFTVTYYCSCTECCGKTDGITASGTFAQEGITVAAD